MADGFTQVVNVMTYFGGGAILTGALVYGPISGMNYGPYASGALVTLAAGAGGAAVMYAMSMYYKSY